MARKKTTCGDYGGKNPDGTPCQLPAAHDRGFINGGMCKAHYINTHGQLPGGRPQYDPDEKEIARLGRMAAVLNRQQIAHIIGIHPSTLSRAARRNPEIDVAINKGKAEAVAAVGTKLLGRANNGDLTAQIFFLKAQGGWREADKLDVNVTGQLDVDFPKLREQFARELNAMADRREIRLEHEMAEIEPGTFQVIEGGQSDDDDGDNTTV